MTKVELGETLARINAVLNSASFLLLVFGFIQIKRKRVDLHRKAMTLAACASVLFLVGYVTRSALTGTHRLAGTGWVKAVYLAILFTHMILAVVNVPLVVRTLLLASRGRFAEHRRIARVTLPIWAYVSMTGIIVYILLYHAVGWID
jgi:putative membrane protein